MRDPVSSSFRIGAVSYLNAKPLLEGIPPSSLLLLPPRLLAEEFEKGAFDVALLPTYTFLKQPQGRAIQGLGIGCEGTVLSVFIKPTSPDSLTFHTLKPSPESMTSNRLTEVLLTKYQSTPFLWRESESDGEVMIGDLAFDFKSKNPTYPLIDLGEAWWNATGLPFVFAMWVLHPQVSDEKGSLIAEYLRKAWLQGKTKIPTYAKTALEFQYLSHYLQYELDSRYDLSLRQWQRDLLEIGSLEKKNDWKWI